MKNYRRVPVIELLEQKRLLAADTCENDLTDEPVAVASALAAQEDIQPTAQSEAPSLLLETTSTDSESETDNIEEESTDTENESEQDSEEENEQEGNDDSDIEENETEETNEDDDSDEEQDDTSDDDETEENETEEDDTSTLSATADEQSLPADLPAAAGGTTLRATSASSAAPEMAQSRTVEADAVDLLFAAAAPSDQDDDDLEQEGPMEESSASTTEDLDVAFDALAGEVLRQLL
jgi:hypothetical protein